MPRQNKAARAHETSELMRVLPEHVSVLPENAPVDFNIEDYINYRIMGFTPRHAALQSGYKSHNDYLKFEQDPYVIERLTGHVNQTRRDALYTRDKVMEVIERGIDICEIQGDGVGMIRGAQEFSKMQGFYAPETKRIEVSVEHGIRQRQISELSEQELLEQLDREQPYIDAEFEELPDEV